MTTQISTLLAIVVSTLALGGLMRSMLSPVLRISRQLHGEDGDERRGIAGRPGILERATATEKDAKEQKAEIAELRAQFDALRAEMTRKLDEALSELRRNGGHSMKDVLDKTYAAVTASSQ